MKDEFKQTEGDPMVKGKIRQMRQARMRKRMMAAVPKASVIITNPTHYAIALQYERGMDAPICVAKGVDAIALKIREVAGEHSIPIVENPPLARALHATVEIDQEIPAEHYKAVAEVIGYVMKLRRGGRPGNEADSADAAGLRMSETLALKASAEAPRACAALRRAVSDLITSVMATQDLSEDARRARPSTAASRRAAAAASAWCCWSRWRWSARRSGCCWSAAATPSPISWRCWPFLAMVGVFSLFALATGILRVAGKETGNPMLKAVVDEAVDGLLVTDPRGRVIYANAAYLDLIDASGRRRRAAGRAGVHRRSRRVGSGLPPAQGGARRPPAQEEVRVAGLKGEPARWLRLRVRPLGDGKRDAQADALDRHRRDARPRAAGKRLPGIAARHRLSRPRAGRLLLGRWQRRHRLSQRHAGRLARPRSGPGRLRRPEARRHRRRATARRC